MLLFNKRRSSSSVSDIKIFYLDIVWFVLHLATSVGCAHSYSLEHSVSHTAAGLQPDLPDKRCYRLGKGKHTNTHTCDVNAQAQTHTYQPTHTFSLTHSHTGWPTYSSLVSFTLNYEVWVFHVFWWCQNFHSWQWHHKEANVTYI